MAKSPDSHVDVYFGCFTVVVPVQALDTSDAGGLIDRVGWLRYTGFLELPTSLCYV
jgi:hypothetical protein